jgi:solute carrier family 25 citrate transporter 1
MRCKEHSNRIFFTAGLAAGITEAVTVVTPMEVVKIRLQAQQHSMVDVTVIPRYRSATHALYTILESEGFRALYRGISLTALRQGAYCTHFTLSFTSFYIKYGKWTKH